MKIAFQALAVALLVVTVITPAVCRLGLWLGAVSRPGGRHVHGRAIPRLGGLAICLALFAAATAAVLFDPAVSDLCGRMLPRIVGLVAGGAAICAIGLMDDIRGIRAAHKLVLQMAVSTAAYACGLRVDCVHVPLLGDLRMGAMGLPVTVFWFLGVINAINLIDGLDGLAAGVVLFAGCAYCVVAHLSHDVLGVVLSAATMGSVLGFLFYNFNPARIFMGDSGSYLLGYVVAANAVIGSPQRDSARASLLVPVVALGVPILDTLLAIVRRTLKRQSIFAADRCHVHHVLLDRGLSQRQAVLLLYASCGLLTIAAIAVASDERLMVMAGVLEAGTVLAGLMRLAGRPVVTRSTVTSIPALAETATRLLVRSCQRYRPSSAPPLVGRGLHANEALTSARMSVRPLSGTRVRPGARSMGHG